MNCNMYTPNSAVENSRSQICALENIDYFYNSTMQPTVLEPDRSSDSLHCILNDLNIGYPEDDRNIIEMGTDYVNTQQASDATTLNSTFMHSNEENEQNLSNCQGKKISFGSTLNRALYKIF